MSLIDLNHKCTQFGMEKTKYLGDGVVTGIGSIDGQRVAIYSRILLVGGALGMLMLRKYVKLWICIGE